MSKRDDDSQADMEVGMTTAERRRRRRRGGGLRVPSDNVPRRSPSTPPVVPPVPEDPALAMSIAYTFTAESSDPMPRTTLESPVPSFENHEGMPTVIDPVAEPVEQTDFEMKTREMTAVDLEALGLSDVSNASTTLPMVRLSSPPLEAIAAPPPESGLEVRFRKRHATDPVDDVDVELDSIDGLTDGGTTLDQDGAEGSDVPEVDSSEFATIDPSDSDPGEVAAELARIRMPVPGYRSARAQTVALSEEDLEEVREAARMSTQAPVRPAVLAMPPPMPQAKAAEPRPRAAAPPPVPEVDSAAFEERVAETTGDFDVDVEGIEARAAEAPPAATDARSKSPSQPPGQGHPPSNPPPIGPQPRDSQPLPTAQPQHAQPPPPPVAHKSPPAPPPPQAKRDKPPAPATSTAAPSGPPGPPPAPPTTLPAGTPLPIAAQSPPPSSALPAVAPGSATAPHAVPPPPPPAHAAPPPPPPPATQPSSAPVAAAAPAHEGRPARSKQWFLDLFDEDYLRTLPFLTPQATQAEAEFVIDSMNLSPGAQILDVGCGYGRHAMELAARGFHVVGLDLSMPLLMRGGEESHRRGLTINFIRGDMRELDFDAQFEGAYCLFSTFGYFEEEVNKKTLANIARALRPGGRLLVEILNRDYVIADLPTRVWWEGDGCVVLEEVELNYFTSRIQVNRSVVFDDGRQLEQLISVRAYSLHEVGRLMHHAGLRVLEVSGAYHTRGRFFGNQSRHIIVLAERSKQSAP